MKGLIVAMGAMLCCAVAFADNAALIGQLEGGTAESRDAARRELLVKAGAGDVPALAALLRKEETFDAAWFLLESIGTPEADTARWGVVEVVPMPEHFRRAAWAFVLRNLDTSTDVAKLKELALHNNAPDDLRIRAVERLEALGETTAAVALYAQLEDHAGLHEHTRLAALCGLLRADAGNLEKWLLKGLSGSEVYRGTTARLAAGMPSKALEKPLAKITEKMPRDVWRVLMSALADAENPAALPMMRKVLKDKNADAEDRLVAVKALGVFGTADDVDTLIALLGQGDKEVADNAFISLCVLKDPKAREKIAAVVFKQKDAGMTVKLLDALARRGTEFPRDEALFMKALKHDAPEVRTVAFSVFNNAWDKKRLGEITAVAAKAVDEREQKAVTHMLMTFVHFDAEATVAAIGKVFANAGAPMRSAFLKAAGAAGSPEGLALVRGALKDADAAVADDAARVLANWKDIAAATDLLAIADTHANNSIRVLALRGYIRLIEQDKDAASREARCREAAKRVARAEERMLLCEALGSVPTQAAVEMLKPFLEDEAVKGEAEKALRRIAETKD